MFVKQLGYRIRTVATESVTTTESNIDINGQAVLFHNTGTGKVYFDITTGVDNTKWELASGEKTTFPFTATNKLYLLSDGTATLKIMYLENV